MSMSAWVHGTPRSIWTQWYAWHPVRPVDEDGIFWLEEVWRRREGDDAHWCYRSFRTEREKVAELLGE